VSADDPPDITRLLHLWQGGSPEALERLLPMVYDELHALASRYMSRERDGHTLQPTALVNEAYLRLAGQRGVSLQDRAHFFAIAARIMRRILVDRARHARREKRGGGAPMLALDDAGTPAPDAGPEPVDAFALDRALSRLEAFDERRARIVELRFFGGLTIEETAQVLDVSTGTVKRDWVVARAWLYRELTGDGAAPPESPGQVE
jgi:RNA polymerase sigma factor (TIGR02999 family)